MGEVPNSAQRSEAEGADHTITHRALVSWYWARGYARYLVLTAKTPRRERCITKTLPVIAGLVAARTNTPPNSSWPPPRSARSAAGVQAWRPSINTNVSREPPGTVFMDGRDNGPAMTIKDVGGTDSFLSLFRTKFLDNSISLNFWRLSCDCSPDSLRKHGVFFRAFRAQFPLLLRGESISWRLLLCASAAPREPFHAELAPKFTVVATMDNF